MKYCKYELVCLAILVSTAFIDEKHALLNGMLFLLAGVFLSAGILNGRKSS